MEQDYVKMYNTPNNTFTKWWLSVEVWTFVSLCIFSGTIVACVLVGVNHHYLREIEDRVKQIENGQEELADYIYNNLTVSMNLQLEAILEAVSLPVVVRDAHVGMPIGTAFAEYLVQYTGDHTIQACAGTDLASTTVGCILHGEFVGL